MSRDLGDAYAYTSDAIPFRDFPFGVCPRLGRGGTSSNRSDDQRGIRLFSARGKYNARGANLSDPASAGGSDDGYDDDTGDLPYEPPREDPTAFDAGPPADLARLLLGGESGFAWPDFGSLGVTSDQSFGVGPIYRGRFAQLSLVVLADQTSHDDLFSARALSGEAGQRFQGFLRAAGLTRRYLIVRSLPVDTLDLSAARRDALANNGQVQSVHREILRRIAAKNPQITALLAMGRVARRLAPHVAPPGLDVIELAAHGESGWAASWQAALTALSSRSLHEEFQQPELRRARGQKPAPAHRSALRDAALGRHVRRPRACVRSIATPIAHRPTT